MTLAEGKANANGRTAGLVEKPAIPRAAVEPQWNPKSRGTKILKEGARLWPSCLFWVEAAIGKTKNPSKDNQQGIDNYSKTGRWVDQAALAKFVGRAGRALGLRGAVNVLVTSSRDLRALNHRFRHKDKATDVLSFPPHGAGRFRRRHCDLGRDRCPERQTSGTSAATEIKILTLHGMLHLAGYDHERDQGEMERKEARLRKTFGLPVGLIERSLAGRKRVVRKPAPSVRRASPR